MSKNRFPPGWDEERVRRVLQHYETQTEEEAVVEDEAAYEDPSHTMMAVPVELVPAVRRLIAEHSSLRGRGVRPDPRRLLHRCARVEHWDESWRRTRRPPWNVWRCKAEAVQETEGLPMQERVERIRANAERPKDQFGLATETTQAIP